MRHTAFAALGLLGAGMLVAVVPAQTASAAGAVNCKTDISYNKNAVAIRCASGPGSKFSAYVLCNNAGGYRFGPQRNYGSGIYSSVGCDGTATVTEYGIYANNAAYLLGTI